MADEKKQAKQMDQAMESKEAAEQQAEGTEEAGGTVPQKFQNYLERGDVPETDTVGEEAVGQDDKAVGMPLEDVAENKMDDGNDK